MDETKKELARLTFPSTDLEEVDFQHRDGSFRLRLTHEGEDGLLRADSWVFSWVRAFQHRAESYCTPWHIDGAYDALVEVEDSQWLAELTQAMPEDMRARFDMHHFMIYLDSYGCYEVIAQAWSATQDEAVE